MVIAGGILLLCAAGSLLLVRYYREHYYAILVGLRAHHVVIWGSVLAAGLLPIWGGLGADRDALAMLPLGVALIASGLLDHRLLVRSFASPKSPNLADRDGAR
ncbi:MAG: hypothetical protein QOD61_2 [Solirubrobacteraceae bacterium]|nr:hypothetical protein [Solirubrobacteraceae bacterium]